MTIGTCFGRSFEINAGFSADLNDDSRREPEWLGWLGSSQLSDERWKGAVPLWRGTGRRSVAASALLDFPKSKNLLFGGEAGAAFSGYVPNEGYPVAPTGNIVSMGQRT
jgi:hypothetical protein